MLNLRHPELARRGGYPATLQICLPAAPEHREGRSRFASRRATDSNFELIPDSLACDMQNRVRLEVVDGPPKGKKFKFAEHDASFSVALLIAMPGCLMTPTSRATILFSK